MPSIDLAPLVQLARLDAPDQGLRDKTLEALGRADAGRGVPELMQALDDNRARVAIYALRRSLMNLRPSQVLDLLARVPRGKVTVAKRSSGSPAICGRTTPLPSWPASKATASCIRTWRLP